jgi:tetratricopeptide (TPR) repeat protein
MLRLTDDEAKHGDVNRLVKRGAMLHADIATLLTEPGSSHGGIIVKDGRYERPGDVVSHWETGRLLLDLIVPSTSGDDLARLWYKATGAYLISTLTFSEAEPHLKRGRALFDPDADLAYLTGLMNEYYASPRLQGFADSLTTPVRSRQYGLEPAHVHLKEAEVLFRRAVELRSDWGEARVRLGRVVGLLGRHEEAAAELEVALTCVGDAPELEYFAQLFLGDEQQALGHRQAAVERYTRAAALFPGAQSPYLALAQIARRYGDRTNALRAANQLLMLPGDATQRGDPWWTYLLLPSSDADALLRTLRSRVSHLEAP